MFAGLKYKMMKIKILLASLIIIFLAQSCDKFNNIFDEQDSGQDLNLTLDQYNVLPFNVVHLYSEDYQFESDSYDAFIGDEGVILTKSSDNQLSFMVPYLEPGDYLLEFELDGTTYDLSLTVNELEEIENPGQIIEQHSEAVFAFYDTLIFFNENADLGIDEGNLKIAEEELARFEQHYSNASEEEKQELAQFMAANPGVFDFSDFDMSYFNDSLSMTKNYVKWDQQLTTDMKYFTGLVIATGATVGLFSAALGSLNPFAIGITGVALLAEILLLKQQTGIMAERSYKPFEFDLEGSLKSDIVEFKNEVEYTLGIDASYRSLYSADNGSSDVVIELVANIEKVKGYWNKVTNHFSDASGTIENISELNNYQVNAQRFSVTPEYISIENISNSNVELIDFNTQNSQVNVTFSTEEEDEQEFTFDIKYDNPQFSEERLTADAILMPTNTSPLKLGGYYELRYSWEPKVVLFHVTNNISSSSGHIYYWDSANNTWFDPSFPATFNASYSFDENSIGIYVDTGGCLSEGFRLENFNPDDITNYGTYTYARCYLDEHIGSSVNFKYVGDNITNIE